VGTAAGDDAVPELGKVLLGSIARSQNDSEMQLETILAISSIGTSTALAVLEETANRPTWFWQRAESRLRRLAAQMLDRPEAERTCLPGGRE